jgi:two-component system, OmpR family, phosphate regulon sensor histidine kinase PhoR
MRRDLAVRGATIALLSGVGGLLVGLGLRGPDARWLVAAVAVVLVSGLVGYLGFRRPAAALRAVADAAGRIAEGELAERVPDQPGPAGELTHAFNVMAGRVESLFDSVAAEHARLEAAFDASDDAMVALSSDTTVRFLNPAAVTVFGAAMSDAIGRTLIETSRDYELDALVRRVIANPRRGETAVVTFGPQRKPLRAAALPIREGGDWAVLLLLTDLTEVQRIDQIRRDFVSNVSHELRTPLAAIRALVETMDVGVEPEEQHEFLARIHQQVERLTALVNELLDLSRIESGAIVLHPAEVHLGELVAEAASLLRTRSESGAVTVIHEGCDLSVEADRASLLRIVSNLLDNAIKWSPPDGHVWVTAKDEGELVALSVRDEGDGIAEQDVPRVFERFFKADGSRSNQGVGLGLAIVKHLVRAHGGTATVESKPGEGATFTVRLPKRFVGRGGRTS